MRDLQVERILTTCVRRGRRVVHAVSFLLDLTDIGLPLDDSCLGERTCGASFTSRIQPPFPPALEANPFKVPYVSCCTCLGSLTLPLLFVSGGFCRNRASRLREK